MKAYNAALSGVSLMVCALLVLISTASGQESGLSPKAAPPNDLPANATVINFPYDAITTNLSQAAQNSEVDHSCLELTGYSVWFRFTVDAPGKVTLDTRESDYTSDDNVMSIYATSPVIGNEIVCVDDTPNPPDALAAIIDFPVNPGTYYVQISNWDLDPDEIETVDFLRLQATFTLDATPTPTETNIATLTGPEETATAGGATLTPTDTTIPPTEESTSTTDPAAELLVNGGMEDDIDANKLPDNWQSKKITSDKIKCNNAKKTVAHSGLCAFRFKGGVGEKSKIFQDVNLANFPLVSGDTLNLSIYTLAKNATTSAKVKVQAKYTDTDEKTTFSQALPVSAVYQQTTGSLTLTSSNINRVRIQIINKSPAGKVFIDDVSLTLP